MEVDFNNYLLIGSININELISCSCPNVHEGWKNSTLAVHCPFWPSSASCFSYF